MPELDWYIEHGNDYPPLTESDLIALDMHVINGRDAKESEDQLKLVQSVAAAAYRRGQTETCQEPCCVRQRAFKRIGQQLLDALQPSKIKN